MPIVSHWEAEAGEVLMTTLTVYLSEEEAEAGEEDKTTWTTMIIPTVSPSEAEALSEVVDVDCLV